ncbi:MAG: hypothetical protein JKY98_07255 [Gammaproteobacteria bacterium]|nr:hypothetical protein [Gammaproteobacteria bacterium]
MEKLVFKGLSSEAEINLFLDKFKNCVGVRLPFDYAKRSSIVGAFLHDKLVGGYMLVTSPEFRSLIFVPDAIKNTNPFFQQNQFEMMEVNGLWISPALKCPKMQLSVWFHLIKDIFLSRKKYVLLMRDLRNKTTERLFNMANPTPLFQGSPKLMAGDNSHDEIQVSYTSRWSIVLNSHKYWKELKNRQQRATQFAEQRDQPRHVKQPGAKYT